MMEINITGTQKMNTLILTLQTDWYYLCSSFEWYGLHNLIIYIYVFIDMMMYVFGFKFLQR